MKSFHRADEFFEIFGDTFPALFKLIFEVSRIASVKFEENEKGVELFVLPGERSGSFTVDLVLKIKELKGSRKKLKVFQDFGRMIIEN